MKPLTIEVTATINLEATEVEKFLHTVTAKIIDALPALKEPRPPAPPPAKTAPAFLTARQLASRWQMHVESIRRMVRFHRLPMVRIGNRLRIPLVDVEKFEAGSRIGPER